MTWLLQLELDAEVEDALDLRVEDLAGQAVARDAEAHHAAGQRAGVADRDGVAGARKLVGGRQPGGPGADDEHALARGRRGDLDAPAAPDRLVADEALDRVDPDRLVELAAVAGGLARVVTDPAHDGGQRVVGHDLPPGLLVVALLGVVEPFLAVLAGRAGVAARRQAVHVGGHLGAPGPGLVGQARADVERDGEGLVHYASSSTRPKRRMLRSALACSAAITSSRRSGLNRCA